MYLKRQLTSTLDRQQNSLKEIRSLQQANKSYSKLINSTSSSNLYNPTNTTSTGLLNSSRTMERHKTLYGVTGQMKRGLSMTEGKSEMIMSAISNGGNNVINNNNNNTQAIVEEVVVESVTQKKSLNRVLTKYSHP